MTQNKTKNPLLTHCENCSSRISQEQLQLIEENQEAVFCSFCGKNLFLKKIFVDKQNSKKEFKKDNNNSNINHYKRETFEYYITIFAARIIYDTITQSNLSSKPTESYIDELAHALRIEFSEKPLNQEWLGVFRNNSRKKFKKKYKEFQATLKMNIKYQENFLIFSRNLIKSVLYLIKYDNELSTLKGMKHDIAEDFLNRKLFERDKRFPEIFKQNLIIALSRLIYIKVKYMAQKRDAKVSLIDLDQKVIVKMAESIKNNIISSAEINPEYINKLYGITLNQFNTAYQNLRIELKESKIYSENFRYLLERLIKNVNLLLSGKRDKVSLTNLERVIIFELKNLEIRLQKNSNLILESSESKNQRKIFNINKFESIKLIAKNYDVKIKIEKNLISQIYNNLKSRFGYTILEIANLTEIELETFRSALYRGNTIPEKAFKKLEELYGRPIPNTRMIGKHKEIVLLRDSDSAEFIGIWLGDGHVSNKSIEMNVSLNGIDDPEYLIYVINFLVNIFDIDIDDISIDTYDNKKLSFIRLNKLAFQKALIDLGFTAGDKIENQIHVPSWIFTDKSFIIRCLRGLIDTDGTITINKSCRCFRISFPNGSKPLVESFKKMCNILGIHTGLVSHSKVFDTRYNKYYDSYSVSVSAKKDVREFFDLVQPKKLEYRRKYYYTWLLILENSEIYKLIKKKIEYKFPQESDRKFSKEYSEFLYSIALEYGLRLIDREFDRVINKSMAYIRCQYSEELGEFLSSLYKELGSRNIVHEFLEFYDLLDVIPNPEAISNFITKYLKEVKGIDFNKWREPYYFPKISFDESDEKMKFFPNKLRSFLIRKIFEFYNYKDIRQESVIYSILLDNVENSYLDFLMENNKYNNAYRSYLKELNTLVIILIEMVINNHIRSDIFIKEYYKFSFSASTISHIKKEVKNLFSSV